MYKFVRCPVSIFILLIISFLMQAHSAVRALPMTCDGATVACRTVVQDVSSLSTATSSPGQYITITCYYNGATPSNICAGGGDFDRGSCDIYSPNGATVLRDDSPDQNCYYRKNFGLNGVVDARQCGVYGDGLSHSPEDDGVILNRCLQIAAGTFQSTDPPLQNKIQIVSTGGSVILANTASITIPPNTELTCSGTGTATASVSSPAKDDDYRITKITNAIVLNPTTADGGPYTIALSGNNETLSGCNILAGGGQPDSGHYPNPYSPAIWYPYCQPTSTATPCTENTGPSLRSALQEYDAFNPNETATYNASNTPACSSTPKSCGPASASFGIQLTGGENQVVRDVTVLGFGTCYQNGIPNVLHANPGQHLIIDHLIGDCDTGLNAFQVPSATRFNDFAIAPFLNRSLMSGSNAQLPIVKLVKDSTSPQYSATIQVPNTSDPTDFRFSRGDTVWIATDTTTGAESAAGRWSVVNSPGTALSCPAGISGLCQTIVLGASAIQQYPEPASMFSSSAVKMSLTGTVNNVSSDGIPPTAIKGIDTTPPNTNLNLVAIGQSIDDAGGAGCIQSGTTVVDVWPAMGTVYMSLPATCPSTAETIKFYDHPYWSVPTNMPDCVNHPDEGCATISAAERFGDGIIVSQSGGVTAVNCSTFDHLTAFHFSTNANSSRFDNCWTGENFALPDQDVVGLRIDGDHSTDEGGDACGNQFENGLLGQHRTVGIVVQSNCSTPNHLSNMRFSGHPGGRRNSIGIELDAGTVGLTNSDAFGNDIDLKADQATLYDSTSAAHGPYPASLTIGNNQFPKDVLYMSDSEAAASTSGCGNTFIVPTPYLCAPSSFTQPPGGRLTLTANQPVMSSDVAGSSFVYYAPYRSQEVPIYNPSSGLFGLADFGAGIQLKLDSTAHAAMHLYDVFMVVDPATGPRLCSGPAWTGAIGSPWSRDPTGVTEQLNGVWVNKSSMTCSYGTGSSFASLTCAVDACTYLGSFYTTAAGQTSQQFGPIAASGGGGNCLCLYNAYNHVSVTSTSQDSGLAYSYASTTWRPQRNSPNNSIEVVDGSGTVQRSAQITDAITNGTGSGAIGVEFLSALSPAQPIPTVQSSSTNKGTYSSSVSRPPLQGVWTATAVEAIVSPASTNATFSGPAYQQLSVEVQD